ncbi:hypothetical protein Mgra_00008674 [Meloidogyne graminicola]|uniref:Exonuclease domain-containing protein n=1 Tax=Meloidogyne graminicola TaxID=189291 RepID=A0A8S9ZF44_9BILA|nr:hypothetical protein Mgra_00008674 [Meloidogyne graminicola]
MEQTKTLIFMDLETTGLFDDNYSNPLINSAPPNDDLTRRLENIIRSDSRRRPHITEISFVSIPSKLFKEAAKQLNTELVLRNSQPIDFHIPVITNIQTRQINPQLNNSEWANYEILRRTKPDVFTQSNEADDEIIEISEIIINKKTTDNLEDIIIAPPNELQRTPDKNRIDIEYITRKSPKRCLFGNNTINRKSHPQTPVTFMKTSNWSPAKRRRINPQFFERNREGNWDFNSHQAKRESSGRGKRTLEALQQRFFIKGLFTSHRAQGDAEALLQCCLAYGEDFISYIDKNKALFPINSFLENSNL